jgi:hypothetical protein
VRDPSSVPYERFSVVMPVAWAAGSLGNELNSTPFSHRNIDTA